MTDIVSTNPLPRGMVAAIGALLLVALGGTAAVRLSGVSVHNPDASPVATRALRFEDRPNGDIAVIDADEHRVVDTVHGEAGFLRGALRALSRQRMRSGIGDQPPFLLIARADGRLTLNDPATGERLDLESFGPTNAATFARLLGVGRR